MKHERTGCWSGNRCGRIRRWVGRASLFFSILVSVVLLVIGFCIYRSSLTSLETGRATWVDMLPLVAMGYSTLLLLALALVELSYYRRLARSHADRARLLSDVMQRLSVQMEEDRKMLSANLHDNIGGALTGLQMEAEHLFRDAGIPAEGQERFFAHFNDLLQRVRGISHALYPSLIGELGLAGPLTEIVERLRTGNMDIRLDLDGQIGILDESIGVCVLRVIQESVVNAVRHAGASRIEVCLRRETDRVRGHVDDDGIGWRASQEGLGLTLMRERVAALRGRLDFRPSPNGGARVGFEIPLTDRGLT